MPTIEDLKRIAEIEFADILTNTYRIDYKLRIVFNDKSFLDAFLYRKDYRTDLVFTGSAWTNRGHFIGMVIFLTGGGGR